MQWQSSHGKAAGTLAIGLLVPAAAPVRVVVAVGAARCVFIGAAGVAVATNLGRFRLVAREPRRWGWTAPASKWRRRHVVAQRVAVTALGRGPRLGAIAAVHIC